jgi:predicted alpha-1,2-mannosidase
VIGRRSLGSVLLLGVGAAATLAVGRVAASVPGGPGGPAALVNPMIGTSSYSHKSADNGDTFPGPDMPFGMIQWSPDAFPSRAYGGGYDYDASQILGFSLNHLSGAGCASDGDVPILPLVGPVPADPQQATARFSHAAETAQVGYYQVTTTSPAAPDSPVTTRLTTATHSGIAQFTFPASTRSDLLLKVADSEQRLTTAGGKTVPAYQKVDGTAARIVGDHEVTGSVTAGHFCGLPYQDDYTLHFDITFAEPFTASGTWAGGPRGGPGGVYLTFDTTGNRTVTAKVGISYISAANAALNLAAEIPGWDFGAVRRANVSAWNALLGRISVSGGPVSQQTEFYTALYHSLLDPHVFSDVNGQYRGMDGRVHTAAAGHAQYADYSGWDIYRDQVQLAALVAPRQTSDVIRSMLSDYDQDGMLPKWAQANGESFEMVGDPADPIIADAYAFGARDFDAGQALRDMVTQATQPSSIRPGQSVLDRYGYLPADLSYPCCNFHAPVSTQLEYDTDDYAIAALARALGDRPAYLKFAARAQNWQNVFNMGTGYVQARLASGAWVPGFTPGTQAGMVEGTAAQYTPMAPFNLSGLIAARGGLQAWQGFLDSLLDSLTAPGPANARLSNEPSLAIPWEYDYAGAPWKTQQAVRRVQTALFANAPTGEPGNDDLGAMSSWFVWSSLGLYPETPGTDTLVIGSPVFPHAVLRLTGGRLLTIDARNTAADAPYVHELRVDGQDWDRPYLTGGQYSRGAHLSFDLGTTPDPAWGAGPGAAPPSDGTGEASVLPYLPVTHVPVPPGHYATVALNSRNITRAAAGVTAAAAPPRGLSVSGPGAVDVPAGGTAQVRLKVTVAAGVAPGSYDVPITLTSAAVGSDSAQPAPITAVLTVSVPADRHRAPLTRSAPRPNQMVGTPAPLRHPHGERSVSR